MHLSTNVNKEIREKKSPGTNGFKRTLNSVKQIDYNHIVNHLFLNVYIFTYFSIEPKKLSFSFSQARAKSALFLTVQCSHACAF